MALSVQSKVAGSEWTAKPYLLLWSGLLKRLPDSSLKRHIVGVLVSTQWPQMTLGAQRVRLGSDTHINLVPHASEFDFNALFNHQLSYEREGFYALETRMPGYDGIIEIGANIGIYTLFFAKQFEKLCKAKAIYAFEPSVEAFYRCNKT